VAAPIQLVERKFLSKPKPTSTPAQRAALLASLWLGTDDETVVVPVEIFVRGVAREIAEAEELAASKRRNAAARLRALE